MSDTSWCGGPWSVRKSPFEVINTDHGVLEYEVCSGNIMLAALYVEGNSFVSNLIAAAPDLYTKVVELHSYLIEEDQNYMGSKAYLETKFLIAKVKGE
jgi:hypothetical protein